MGSVIFVLFNTLAIGQDNDRQQQLRQVGAAASTKTVEPVTKGYVSSSNNGQKCIGGAAAAEADGRSSSHESSSGISNIMGRIKQPAAGKMQQTWSPCLSHLTEAVYSVAAFPSTSRISWPPPLP